MTEVPEMPAPKRIPTDWKSSAMTGRIAKRYRSERFFKWAGFAAVALSASFLAFLLISMTWSGARGFTRMNIALPVDFAKLDLFIDPASLKGGNADTLLANAGLEGAIGQAATQAFGPTGPELIAETSWLTLRDAIKADPSVLQKRITLEVSASSDLDQASRGEGEPALQATYARLDKAGVMSTSFNGQFLTGSDATDPTQVGIWGAFKGSLITMLVTLALAFPIGVLSAVYLEEYAPRNRWTDIIEVSINNLAAVPSIIFGLLGLAVFLNTMGLPRSAPLVGGLTLALMTMPVIVIAGRNAIKAVPPSIRDAALGIGASPVQVVFHHVLPLALPGILTGTIIGMARALGETAPLLMIGMRAFITTPPDGITSPASVLPVQIFLWSDEVSRGFVEKTSAAIIVLLAFLLTMNGIAIYLRNRFEQRW
jgi:phosphate transport system permease protein